jgi:hypothetical protein
MEATKLAIHGSADDLKAFAARLVRLAEGTKEGCFDHDHFMTEDWGGSDLTSVPQCEESELLNHR